MFEWVEDAAGAVGAIGTPEFPATFSEALRTVAPFDYNVVFGYVGTNAPIDLFDDFPASKRRIFVEDYQGEVSHVLVWGPEFGGPENQIRCNKIR